MRKNFMKGIVCFLVFAVIILLSTGCFHQSRPVSSSFAIEGKATQKSGPYLEINLNVPVLSGFDSAQTVNDSIRKSVAAAEKDTEEVAAILAKTPSEMKAGLTSGYLYSKSGNLISLWLMMKNYSGGAHGLYWIDTYTFNTGTNEIYRFPDLFRDGYTSAALVTEKIIKKIGDNPGGYFPSAIEGVKKYDDNLPYYINGNKLVVFFPLYEIAPYAAGINFFDFDAEELKAILKPEIYDNMKAEALVDTKGTILEH
jgi:hypothetical protein